MATVAEAAAKVLALHERPGSLQDFSNAVDELRVALAAVAEAATVEGEPKTHRKKA